MSKLLVIAAAVTGLSLAALTYVSFSNSRGGCFNATSTNGSIWINCATHLWG